MRMDVETHRGIVAGKVADYIERGAILHHDPETRLALHKQAVLDIFDKVHQDELNPPPVPAPVEVAPASQEPESPEEQFARKIAEAEEQGSVLHHDPETRVKLRQQAILDIMHKFQPQGAD